MTSVSYEERVIGDDLECDLNSNEYYEEIDDDVGSSSDDEVYFYDTVYSQASKLEVVHENDDDDSDYQDEEVSESEVLWEEVSESMNGDGENVDDGFLTEELVNNSDMIERVRNILLGGKSSKGDGSQVDSSSQCSSSMDEGSSSAAPMDFDLGSYEEAEIHSSDEEGDVPEDYEQACRVMIATVHPHLDPDKFVHGCDLQNLYTNLKQQYRHLLRSGPESLGVESIIEDEQGIIEDDDVDGSKELTFQLDSTSGENFVSLQPISDDESSKCGVKNIPVERSNLVAATIENHAGSENVTTSDTPKVEKWLERDADDPEDFEHACRCLCKAMYDENDPDYDVDTMLRRSTPVDLYRYLKPHFWYLVHTKQLDENALNRVYDDSNENDTKCDKGTFNSNDDEKKIDEPTHLLDSNPATDEVPEEAADEVPEGATDEVSEEALQQTHQSLRSLLSARTEKSEQSKHEIVEISEPEEVVLSKFNHQSIMDKIEIYNDNGKSNGHENEMQMCHLNDENLLPNPNNSGHSNEGGERINGTEESMLEEVIHNSPNITTVSLPSESESSECHNDACGLLPEKYSSESGSMLDEHEDKDVNEDRLCDSKSCSEKAIGGENYDGDRSSDNKMPLTMENEESVEICLEHDLGLKENLSDFDEEGKQPVGDIANSNEGKNSVSNPNQTLLFGDAPQYSEKGRGEVEEELILETDQSIENDNTTLSLNHLQNEGGRQTMALKGQTPKTILADPEELEWRKNEIQVDLKNIIEETEDEELCQSFSPEIVAALNAGSMKTALTKKYFDQIQQDYIYYPSVAKAVYNFSLIEEAEKVFRDEIPFELSTALCTVAASRLKENDDEIDESNISIKKATEYVFLDDQTNAESDEKATRSKMIEKELASIMYDVKHQVINTNFEPIVAAALQKAAYNLAYLKKYFDSESDKYFYFPSVAKIICNFSLIDEAKMYLSQAGKDLSPDLTKVLCSIAESHLTAIDNKLNEDIVQKSVAVNLHESSSSYDESCDSDGDNIDAESLVGEFDNNVIKMAVDIHINDSQEGNKSDKRSDVSVANDTASIISSEIDSNSVDTEDLPPTEKEASSSSRQCNTECSNKKADWIEEGLVVSDNVYTDNLQAQLEGEFNPKFCGGDDTVVEKETLGTQLTENVDSELLADVTMEEESRLQEMAQILAFKRRVGEQKILNDTNALEKRKKSDTFKESEEAQKVENDFRTFEAALEEKASLLLEKYADDKRAINQALIDLESELKSELKRIDNEANEFSARQKTETERIENDRKGVEEQFLVDENNMMEQTKSLLEKLSTAVAVLETERKNACTGMEMVEVEKGDVKNWGWFSNKSKKNNLDKEKLKQEKLMRFKLREIELEKDIDGIKTQLDLVKQQAKAKKQNISEWQMELDDEYRHLENVTAATEEKLREEIERLRASYEEERQRLLRQRNFLEETRKDDDEWLASEKENLRKKYNLERGEIMRAKIERNEIEKDEEDRLNKDANAAKEKWNEEEKELLLEQEAFEQKKEGHDSNQSTFLDDDEPKEIISAFSENLQSQEGVTNTSALDSTEHSLRSGENTGNLIENNAQFAEMMDENDSRLLEQTKGETISHQLNLMGIADKGILKSEQIAVEKELHFRDSVDSSGDTGGKEFTPGGNVRDRLTQTEDMKNDKSGDSCSSGSDTLGDSKDNTHCIEGDTVESLATDMSKDERTDRADTNTTNGDCLTISKSEEIPARERSTKSCGASTQSKTMDIREDGNSATVGNCIVPDHLALLNQPRKLQDEVSLGSIDLFDPPEEHESSSKKLLAAALKGKLENDIENKTTEDETQMTDNHLALADPPLQHELSLSSGGEIDSSKSNELLSRNFLAATSKGKQDEGIAMGIRSESILEANKIKHYPSKNLLQMRRKVEIALERATAIRNGGAFTSNDINRSEETKNSLHLDPCVSHESRRLHQVETKLLDNSTRETSTGIHIDRPKPSEKCSRDDMIPSKGVDRSKVKASSQSSRQPPHPIYPMIRETDRLSGFIRRYEKKLETVCKSLLTLASVTGDENDVLAARELDLPEMLSFIVKQDWYKAHSTEMKAGVPNLVFSKVNSGCDEGDCTSDDGYKITDTGKLFLQIDGPVHSDVCRFLTYLERMEDGLTRDAMFEQWKEIARLSGDEQSQRVCEKIDKLISFCLDSRMIKK